MVLNGTKEELALPFKHVNLPSSVATQGPGKSLSLTGLFLEQLAVDFKLAAINLEVLSKNRAS